MRTIDEIRADARASYERSLAHIDRLESFYEKLCSDLAVIEPSITVDSMDVNVHLYGGKPQLERAFGCLRRLGFSPAERPKENATEYRSRFSRDDGASVYLFFTSTVCRRVQVGTRTVEEPVYEIQCGDDAPAESAAA